MEANRPARILAVALAVGGLVGVAGNRQAHALVDGPAAGADVHFVIGSAPGGLSAVRVDLHEHVRRLSVRLDGGRFLPCRLHGREATCPVPPGAATAADLSRVALAAER